MIWNIAWILADSKNHPPMASMGAPSAKSPLICSWYSSNRLYLQLAQSKQIHLFSQLCKFWPINEVKVWTFLFIHHTSASSTSRMLSWPRIVIISKILVKDYPVVVDKEERFRGKTFCKFEHFTPGHKTLASEWFWGVYTLWEDLHYGQGRKCDSQLLRQPSRWSHPSGGPVIIIFVIMIIIIFRIIIVICSGP